jgi:hypothetical protein
MAKLSIVRGTTNKLIKVFVQASNASTGVGLAGLTNATAGLTLYSIREGDAADAAVALVAGTVGTWSSGGFKEIDPTNMLGWYEIGLPNAMLALGASAAGHLQGAANMAPCPIEIELTSVNNQDAAAFGLTRLDAAVSSREANSALDFGTSQSATASTIRLRAGASAIDGFYADGVIVLTNGTGVGQARRIASYVGATTTATVDTNWLTTPDATTTYTIFGTASHKVHVVVNDDKAGYTLGSSLDPTAQTIADAVMDLASIETGLTFRQLMRGLGAALMGLSSNGPLGTIFRAAVSNSKPRITSVADASGNRTGIVTDLTP